MLKRSGNSIMSKKISKNKKKQPKHSINDDLQTKEELEIEQEKFQQEKQDIRKQSKRQKGSQQNSNQISNNRRQLNEEDSDEDNVEYNIEDLNKNTNKVNHDAICDILNGLKLKNKLNKQNSFDLPLPDVSKLTDFQGSDAHHWKKLATTLDTTAKIYGYRVDRTYDDSIKTLNGLSRNTENKEDEEDKLKDKQQLEQDQITNSMNQEMMERQIAKKSKGGQGEATLEKKIDNLNVIKYDLEFDIDPLFQKTSAQFDGGQSNLLLNSLNIDSNLLVVLDSQSQTNAQIKKQLQIQQQLEDEGMVIEINENENNNKFVIPKSMQGKNNNNNYTPSYNNFQDLGDMEMEFRDSVKYLRQFFSKDIIPELNNFQDTMYENFMKSTIRADEKKNKRWQKLKNKEDPFSVTQNKKRKDSTDKQIQEQEDQEILEQINILIGDEEDDQELDNYHNNYDLENNQDQMEFNDENKENMYENDCIEQEFNNNNDFNNSFQQNDYQDQEQQQQSGFNDYLLNDQENKIGNGNEFNPEKSILTLSSLENKLNFIDTQIGKNNDNALGQNQNKKIVRKNRILDTIFNIRDQQQKLKEKKNLLNTHLEYAIDFDQNVKFQRNEIYEKKSNTKQNILKVLNGDKDDQNLKHYNLLPFDIHYKHINAFGGCSLLNYKNILPKYENQQDQSQLDNIEDIYGNGGIGEMGNNEDGMDFEGLSNTEEGLKTSLLKSIITVKNMAKNKTSVPIKELKNQIWQNIATKIPTVNYQDSEEQSKNKRKKSTIKEKNMEFEHVVGNMEDIFGEKSNNISIQTTFLTLLHLANEKLLKFEINEEEDNFKIYKDQQLFMNEVGDACEEE